jgi:hypothetical protein
MSVVGKAGEAGSMNEWRAPIVVSMGRVLVVVDRPECILKINVRFDVG